MELKENVLERFRLDKKTAVITGGAGNIGSHTAKALAQAGAGGGAGGRGGAIGVGGSLLYGRTGYSD